VPFGQWLHSYNVGIYIDSSALFPSEIWPKILDKDIIRTTYVAGSWYCYLREYFDELIAQLILYQLKYYYNSKVKIYLISAFKLEIKNTSSV